MSTKQVREAFEKEHPIPQGVAFNEITESYDTVWGGPLSVCYAYRMRWEEWQKAASCNPEGQSVSDVQPVEMNAERAAFFMQRFKTEEKMLGPHEQAALDYVLGMLAGAMASQPMPLEPAQDPSLLDAKGSEQSRFEAKYPPPQGVCFMPEVKRYCVGASGMLGEMITYQAAWVSWQEMASNQENPLVTWL